MGFLKKVMNAASNPAAANRTNQQNSQAAPSNYPAQNPQYVQASVYQPHGMPAAAATPYQPQGMPAATATPAYATAYCAGSPAGGGATAYNAAPPTGAAPKKYVKTNGVMKLNPEYKRWQESQTGAGTATSLPNSAQALPVVSSMEDHMQLNDDLGTNIPLAESTDATIEMMQDPDFCADAGMNPDTMVDELGSVLSKYEVPMGLMNKVRCSIFMMSTKCINSFRSLHISPFASIY